MARPLSRAWEHLFGQLQELFTERARPDPAMIATKLVEACLLVDRCPADAEGRGGAARASVPSAGSGSIAHHFARMLAIIDSHPQISAREVAERVGLHPHYASRLFGQAMGQSLTRYIRKRHLDRARHLLATSCIPIGQIADTCGFRDMSTFYRAFVKEYRRTPGDIRRQGAPPSD